MGLLGDRSAATAFAPPDQCGCPSPHYDSPSKPCCEHTSCCCHLALDGDMNSTRAYSHAQQRLHGDEKPKSVPMRAIPLFELSWREYAHGESGTYGVVRSQTHLVRIEREAAMSLFSALTAASDFYDVKVEKSKWNTYVSDPDAKVEADVER